MIKHINNFSLDLYTFNQVNSESYLFCCLFVYCLLEMEPRASSMQGKHFSTVVHSQPLKAPTFSSYIT